MNNQREHCAKRQMEFLIRCVILKMSLVMFLMVRALFDADAQNIQKGGGWVFRWLALDFWILWICELAATEKSLDNWSSGGWCISTGFQSSPCPLPPIHPPPQPPILLPIATSASPLHHPPYQDAFTDSQRRLFHVHISLEWHFHMRQNIRTRTNIIVVILKLFISTVQTFGEFWS